MANWDAARWRAVSAEIDRILDLPLEARQSALDALRARDAALAADVARLLAEQPAVEAGGFLEGGAASALPTVTSTSGDGVAMPRPPVTLPAGATFGSYRIHRMLGRGGMGIVYEAEEIESGRRVALKILQGRFDDDRERERFEREGQLAASIDHEHCVFVFGAAEVDGTPSIAMELMQGTLADRLAADGPMPPAAAVDAALQLVAGLQAAQVAGILHRDVKPSNCFVDADGVVKIGDFGISRSTRPAQETTRATRGLVAATPAYAPPEQLRGAPLDARSDIYSLGATLYELLTAERPFTGPHLMALLMAVANDPPRPPHVVAPAMAKGLSQVVLRCLAKRPEDRYQSYEALATALEPYASWSPTAATLGRRLLAGVIDHLVFFVPTLAAGLALLAWWFAPDDPRMMLLQMTMGVSIAILYYGICESRWGAGVGKALMGLTVVTAEGRPPGIGIALLRALVFVCPRVAVTLIWIPFTEPIETLMQTWPMTASLGSFAVQWLLWSTLFWTARHRNGYAALHDVASGTRVVTRVARTARGTALHASRSMTPDPLVGGDAFGGFIATAASVDGRPGWRHGYDARLRRAVWIRPVPIRTRPVPAARAALARPTRLRWLAGRRTGSEAWDVYEAVDGVPLARALQRGPEWKATRRWLADLASELMAQDPRDRPPLDPDAVWILASGRVKLLDDPTEDAPPDARTSAEAFLAGVIQRVRGQGRGSWPVAMEQLLRRLPEVSLAAMAAQLEALQSSRAAMTRQWRLLTLAPLGVLVASLAANYVVTSVNLVYTQRSTPPDLRIVKAALSSLRTDDIGKANGAPTTHRHRLSDADRAALEVFLATRHRPALADERLYNPRRLPGGRYEFRGIAERVLRRPPVSAAEATAAAANPLVLRVTDQALSAPGVGVLAGLLVILFVALAVGAAVTLVLAATFRGVVLRLLGFEIVSATGLPASRLRVTTRALVAWCVVLLPVVGILARGGAPLTTWPWILVPAASLCTFVAGAAYAVWSPVRGIQDRLAGTWIVPR